MVPETNVRIASLSKMFTSVVVLQLAAEGVIDLDAPVATYLPELLPNGDTIMVRNLLNHTSGLYDYLEDWDFAILAYQEPERIWAPQELVEYATQFAPSFQPGSEGNWDYASTNYVALGMIVEQVTGNSLAQEMRRRIFEPLALEHTYFPPDEELPETIAHGYAGSDDQTAMAPSFAFATGNIVSTADDIRRFVQALLGGDLLPQESLAQMLTFVDGHGQYEMPALEYGYGIMRNRLADGAMPDGQPRPASTTTVLGHIGGIAGFRSAVWSSPEAGITIALGANQAAIDPNTIANRLFDTILTHQGR
jgi:D-alanyl-D-alanine carboxypeptidase